MRRLVRLLVRLLVVAIVTIAAGAAVLVWRLQRGPLALDVLVPRITASLAENGDGVRAGIDALELVWRPDTRHVELRARGLRIARPDGSASVQLDAVRIRLRRRALLRARVDVEAIELERPDLHLVRDAAGRFDLQIGTAGGETSDVAWVASALGQLEHVTVRDGRIVFVDERSRTTWSVPHVDGDAWRAGGPLRVQLGVSLTAADTTIPLWISGIYRFESATLALEVSTSGAETTAAFAAWPASLAPQAHGWVTSRIRDGRIGPSVLAASGHVVQGDEGRKLVLDGLDASVPFEGLTVRYLDTMPAASDVGGVGRFTRDGVAFAVTSGRLEKLAIGPASVRIAWPRDAPNRIAIDARTRGPLASLVAVLDHEPIGLGRRVALPATGEIGGSAATRVRLAFPLDRRPALGKLGLRGRATIEDATVPGVAGRFDVTAGAAAVEVDERTVAVTGAAELGGLPVRFRYADHLAAGGANRLAIESRLDVAERERLGLPSASWLTGPVDVRLRIAPRRNRPPVADLDADLGPAAVDLPSLALRKPAGSPGRALARLTLARADVAAVKRFQLDAGDVTIRGSAARASDGGAWSRIDAAAALGPVDRRGNMTLGLRAGGETPGWLMTLTSPDLGLLLRAYGYENASGGTLELSGTVGLGTDGLPFDGQLTAEHVTLTRVPFLVKTVSLASVRGLVDLGSGAEQAVAIDRAVATVAHRPPSTIEIRDAVARGPKIGLTLAGRMDHVAGTIDLSGTLVPSYYMLNEGVANIPVVGGVLGKVTGGAVQAVSFTARGPRTDPTVAVQPLSSLAPGAVREWLRKLGL